MSPAFDVIREDLLDMMIEDARRTRAKAKLMRKEAQTPLLGRRQRSWKREDAGARHLRFPARGAGRLQPPHRRPATVHALVAVRPPDLYLTSASILYQVAGIRRRGSGGLRGRHQARSVHQGFRAPPGPRESALAQARRSG
jgi:hypothetical protein